MKKLFYLIFTFAFTLVINANDSSYTIKGNQLVPIDETDISVIKEMLSIDRNPRNSDQVNVTVYYEFYNKADAKTLLVGFEAERPLGEYFLPSKNGVHPNMHNFTVALNGQKLRYQTSIALLDIPYYKDGNIQKLNSNQIDRLDDGEDYVEYLYVYHFEAQFKKGLNIIEHTYTCDLSSSVMFNYQFDYILSAAMRWGNKQIDDFTLKINMGKDQLISTPQTFFDSTDEWTIVGVGKKQNIDTSYFDYMNGEEISKKSSLFFIKDGYLIFQKLNFSPKGELVFISPYYFNSEVEFDCKVEKNIYSTKFLYHGMGRSAKDEISKKILRNLPFAERGYIFSTPELQEYFQNQIWYFPDLKYRSEISTLSDLEQEWVNYWSK